MAAKKKKATVRKKVRKAVEKNTGMLGGAARGLKRRRDYLKNI